jgi:hypothetical protein
MQGAPARLLGHDVLALAVGIVLAVVWFAPPSATPYPNLPKRIELERSAQGDAPRPVLAQEWHQ